MLTYFIPGRPIPQGSKGATKQGRLFDTNAKDLKPWRKQVTAITKEVNHVFPKSQPVTLTARFIFKRPKTVKRTYMSVKPDIDKLCRSLLDGITDAGMWDDDSRVIALTATKEYGDAEGAWVTVKAVPNDLAW